MIDAKFYAIEKERVKEYVAKIKKISKAIRESVDTSWHPFINTLKSPCAKVERLFNTN